MCFLLPHQISESPTGKILYPKFYLRTGSALHVQYDVSDDPLRCRDRLFFHFGARERIICLSALFLYLPGGRDACIQIVHPKDDGFRKAQRSRVYQSDSSDPHHDQLSFLSTGVHLLAAGFFFGLGYGILQPLFQSFVTGTTPAPKRGVANATYMLSYDIGIGIGSLLMGFMQESLGLSVGFALTAIAYVIGALVYVVYVDRYYRKLRLE